MKEIRADAWQNKFCEREMAFCYCFQGPNTNVTLHLLSSGAEEQPHRTTTTIKVYDRAAYCLYLKCCYGCILYILSARPSSSLENIHIMFKACNHYSSPPQYKEHSLYPIESHHQWTTPLFKQLFPEM